MVNTRFCHHWLFSLIAATATLQLRLLNWYNPELCIDSISATIKVVTDSPPTAKQTDSKENALDINSNNRYRHDFTYNHKNWDDYAPPRIALLASTHKAASTTIQKFFVELTHATIKMLPNTILEEEERTRHPHPSITDWVWPIGANSEVPYHVVKEQKTFAPLADFIVNRKEYHRLTSEQYLHWFPNHNIDTFEESRETIAGYFRSLIRQPWEEGKKIILAAEAFDVLTRGLLEDSVASDQGEETHVSPDADAILDNLLDLLPFEHNKTDTRVAKEILVENSNNNNRNELVSVSPLQLKDIEVHIHHRTSRIDHLVSLWHQAGYGRTFREFITCNHSEIGRMCARDMSNKINPLAVALQYVRRGIKTTLVDMQGVVEANRTLPEVAACDVLKIGNGQLCDDHGTLHISNSNSEPHAVANKKTDQSLRALTHEQMESINHALNRYDCGVWQHLQKYQQKGVFRILHPSKYLFATCNPEGSRDISYRETVETIAAIASLENGIAVVTDQPIETERSENSPGSKTMIRRRIL